jgi:hypothetical protein
MLRRFTPAILLLATINAQAQEVPNGSFENWTNDQPDGWFSFFYDQLSKETEGYDDASALRGDVFDIGGGIGLAPYLAAGINGNGFTIAENPDSLEFWVKLNLEGGDVLEVLTSVVQADDEQISGGSMSAIYLDQSSPLEWFRVRIPFIPYTPEGAVGDTCTISLTLYDTLTQTGSLGSYFIADAFRLVYFDDTGVEEFSATSLAGRWGAFPNPLQAGEPVRYELARPANVQADILDATGRVVHTLRAASHQAPGQYTLTTAELEVPTGCYLLRLSVDGMTDTRRVMMR